MAQLRTLFGNGGSFNELFLNYETIRDRRNPGTFAPAGHRLHSGYPIIDGSERYSQGNQLDQDLIEMTDNYTLPLGAHRVTFGAQGQWYKVRNLFTQASYGVWTFGTLDSLAQGLARQYVVGVPLCGDGAVRFRAGNYAAYVQDEWTVIQSLSADLRLRSTIRSSSTSRRSTSPFPTPSAATRRTYRRATFSGRRASASTGT